MYTIKYGWVFKAWGISTDVLEALLNTQIIILKHTPHPRASTLSVEHTIHFLSGEYFDHKYILIYTHIIAPSNTIYALLHSKAHRP